MLEPVNPRFQGVAHLVVLGLALGVAFWVVDSLVDALVFRNGSVLEEALNPSRVELWMRLFVASLLVCFSVYVGLIITKRKQAETGLRAAYTELEGRVRERTSELEQVNAVLQAEIANREEARKALQRDEVRLRHLLETTNVIPWEADARTMQFTYVGPQAADLLGYPLHRWYENEFWDAHIHPDDRERTIAFCVESSRRSRDYEFEYRMIAADGRVVWLHDIVNVDTEYGEPKTLRGFLIDITGRRKVAEELERSERRFRRLLETAPDAIVLARQDGTIVFVNEQAEQWFGYGREDMVGQPVEMMIPERLRHEHANGFAAFDPASPVRSIGNNMEFYGLRKNGTEFPVEISLSPLETDEGLLICSSIRDVTERRRVKEALAESGKQLRLMADALPVLISYADVEQRYRFVNRAFEEWLGLSSEALRGRTVKETIGKEAHEAIRPHIEEALSGRDVSYERDVLRRGAWHRLRVSLVPHRDSDGNVVGVYALASDVTEQVRAEQESRRQRQELAHVSRAATMGELGASLAHELNQPLSAIISNAQASRRFLAGEAPDVAELREALRDIIEDGKRAAEVIRGLRALLQKGDIERRALDLNEVVRGVATLMHGELVVKNIRLKLDLASNLPPVFGDMTQLQQVLLNLILNGSEAMNEVDGADRELAVRTSLDGPGTLVVSVRDSGPGLDANHTDRLFDPFFTTKPEGLGMGLSINRSIVEAHHGRLWATPNPDQGATFHFTLPAAEKASS
jgi:PAS domain S-box-containing protein